MEYPHLQLHVKCILVYQLHTKWLRNKFLCGTNIIWQLLQNITIYGSAEKININLKIPSLIYEERIQL